MGLIAKSTESNTGFIQPEVGVHEARCVKVIDLGTQKSTFEGETTWKRQVMLIWELPEQLKDGMPLTIGDDVTVGHKVILHSCTVGNNSLIGMGSTVLNNAKIGNNCCLLYTSPSPRDATLSRMPSSA